MAKGDKSNQTSKLTLRQEISTDKLANQTLNNINPSATDDMFLELGNKLGALSEKTLDSVIRTNSYTIAAE